MFVIDDPNPDHLTGALAIGFWVLINTLLEQQVYVGPIDIYPKNYAPELVDNSTFDFVIVGGGTSGCVLANRLTQINGWRVLILETGGYPPVTTDVPRLHRELAKTEESIWNFHLQHNPHYCQGMQDKRCGMYSGKALGGTSTVNDLHYYRGTYRDFEVWYEDSGNDWTNDIVEYYYKRIEQYSGNLPHSVHYGSNGDIPLHQFNITKKFLPITRTINSAAEELGYNSMRDGELLGYSRVMAPVVNGTRINMAKAFLSPIKNRTNLFMALDAHVTKIIVDKETINRAHMNDITAKGVEVWVGDELKRIYVNKEIILTGGAINTPKLLMLSGIGPSDQLNKFDIPVVMDLPVGENFQDHLAMFVVVGLDPLRTPPSDSFDYVDSTYQYIMYRSGTLATTGCHDLIGFINNHLKPRLYPNIAIYHYYFQKSTVKLGITMEKLGYHRDIVKSGVKYNKRMPLILFLPTLLSPKSRGRVRLNSTSPLDDPIIEPNYFSDKHNEDFETLYAAYQHIINLLDTKPMVDLSARLLHIDIPNCRNFKFCTKAYMRCALRNMAYPRSHAAGTAKMSRRPERKAVVNEKLLVRGFSNLRIVDSSVMPRVVSANLMATTAMMGDRASEMIKEKWIREYIAPEKAVCDIGDKEGSIFSVNFTKSEFCTRS